MVKTTKPTETSKKDTIPKDFAVTTPGTGASYEPMHLLQMMLTVQKEVATLTAETKHLTSVVEKLDTKVENFHSTLNIIKGAGGASLFLIPAFMAFIWWLIGGQITDLKNQLVAHPPIQQSQSEAIGE